MGKVKRRDLKFMRWFERQYRIAGHHRVQRGDSRRGRSVGGEGRFSLVEGGAPYLWKKGAVDLF